MTALNSSADVAAQATNVRAELKVWEKAFASANGGKKAGRDDIKQNAEIGRSNLSLWGTLLTRRVNLSRKIQGIQSSESPRVISESTGESPAGTIGQPLQKAEACITTRSRSISTNYTSQVVQRAFRNPFQQPHQDSSSRPRSL